MLEIEKPYLIYLGNVQEAAMAKTGFGIRDWSPESCVAQFRLPNCKVDLGLPDCTPHEAAEKGAQTLIIGLAPVGGALSNDDIKAIEEALDAGLDIAAGLHDKLQNHAGIAALAGKRGRRLLDVRAVTTSGHVGTGRKRSGKRLLTVGTDCACGKKYTALAIARELQECGVDADFRATGQTGVLISGHGVAMDSVVSDFLSGAAEALSPDAPAQHWDVIEGQGAIMHPAFAAVTLGLLHGSQPDALVLCHDVSRFSLLGFDHMPIPSILHAIDTYTQLAFLTNPHAKFVGISLNTSSLDEASAYRTIEQYSKKYDLPCTDPVRFGVRPIVENMINAPHPSQGVTRL